MIQEMSTLEKSFDDAAITDLVKTTLGKYRSTAVFIIAVETRNGVVKIDGKAGNWDEKNLVTKLVNNIHCLKMVFNNMTIDRNMPTIAWGDGSQPVGHEWGSGRRKDPGRNISEHFDQETRQEPALRRIVGT